MSDPTPRELQRQIEELRADLATLEALLAERNRPGLVRSNAGRARHTLLGVLVGIPVAAYAATISMPHTCVNGTTADANQVNANFDVLVQESNAQDVRIATLEAGVPPGGPAGGDLAGTYPNPSLAADAVTTGEIANFAVTAAKIQDNAVSASKIQTSAVGNPQLADNAVSTGRIQDGAVSAIKIQDSAVLDSKIATGAVGPGKIAADAVTNAQLADNAVTSAEIAPDAVTAAKIAASAVGSAEITTAAVTGDKIAIDAVDSPRIADGSVRFQDWHPNGCVVGQIPKWNGASWVCANDI